MSDIVPGPPEDPPAEYRAARHEAALFHRSDRGRLRLSGRDALDLLQRTTTGQLKGLAPGSGALTVIQTETARVLDLITLWTFEDHVVAVTGPGRAAADREWLDRMVIMDEVEVRDESAGSELFELIGPRAGGMLSEIAGVGLEELKPHAHRTVSAVGGSLVVARGAARTPDSWWVMASPPDAAALERELVEHHGVRRAGRLADESLRLERGIPAVGRELTAETNPLEARLEEAIGFGKGCYTGQEVIARMITNRSVRRVLSGLALAHAGEGPEPGRSWPLARNGAPAGRMTSAAYSFGLGRWIGLGFVMTEAAAPGTAVVVEAGGGAIPAEVAALPFLP